MKKSASSWLVEVWALALLGILSVAIGCGDESSSSRRTDASAGAGGSAPEGGATPSGAAGEAGMTSSGAGGQAGSHALSEQDMFALLGVDTTVTPRTYIDEDQKEQELDDSYNPLGAGVRPISPIAEVYLAGRGVDGAHENQVLFDDMAAGKQAMLTPLGPVTDDDESWLSNKFKLSLAADLNGDGVDEVVNLYWIDAASELHANVVACTDDCTGNGGTFSKVKDSKLSVQDPSKTPTSIDWFRHGAVAADVDGDGKKEIVVVGFGGVEVCTASAAFTLTCKAAWTNAIAKNVSVAAGRFEEVPGIQREGVVVAWSDGSAGYVSVFDGTPHAFAANAFSKRNVDPISLTIKFADKPSPMSFSEAFVTAGNIDVDGHDEIVLAAREAGGADHDLILLDDASGGYAAFHAFRYSLGQDGGRPHLFCSIVCVPNPSNHLFRPALRVFTKTTEPTLAKAIYAGSYIFDKLDELLPANTLTLPQGKDMTNGVGVTMMSFYETGGGGFNHGPNDVVAGDIDGSGKDSIVGLWDEVVDNSHTDEGFNVTTLAKVSWDVGAAKWSRWKNVASTTSGLTPFVAGDEGTYDIGLALPNVDRDSPIVEYRGEHEVLFSTPRVLAVLAAPPFFSDVNEANSKTAISFGTGQGQGADSNIGVRAGVSIGYESPNLFGALKARWKLSFGLAMDTISKRTVQLTESQTWAVGAEDGVVFQVIPFDVYYYRVVSSPDPTEIGSTLSINVPRSLKTYKVPVALYNRAIVGGPQLGPEVLTHTVGKPETYPSVNACEGAASGGQYNGLEFLLDPDTWCYASQSPLRVGVGTGSVAFDIARTEMTSNGFSRDVSVDFEAEATVGGFTAGVSVGYHWGYTYTVDTSKSYWFTGQVGDLPDASRGYDFGLMVHKGSLAGNADDYPVFLVDYWVEDIEQ